jgi:diketogulonate reductase-like aldo/keto reductase
MEQLKKEGKIRCLGVSNFNVCQLQDVLKNCETKPAMNQIEVLKLIYFYFI